MKTLYRSILVIGLGVISLSAAAQKDSVLTRQVLLERDYNPTLQDASKINTLPSIYTPVVRAKDFKFLSSSPQITLTNRQLGAAESGDIKTNIDFSKKRGYLILGAGTNANLDGALGYRLVNAEKDRLDIFASHSSTSSYIDYIQKNYLLKDAKAKHAANKINLKYQHQFDMSILSLGGSFYNTSYNYYGNSFLPIGATSPYDISSSQNVDVFSFGAGLRSSENNGGELKYIGNINYQNFKTKYGIIPTEKGPKGGQLDLNLNLFAEFDSDKTVGVKAMVMNQSFSKKGGFITDSTYHGFTNITGTPYIKMQGASWDVDLGVNVSGLFDAKTKILFSPNIKAEARIDDVNVFYGEVTGGVNNNTYLDVIQENRYVDLVSRVAYSKTLFDAKVGFKSGVVSGLEFDVFAGYKKTDNDHLYVAHSSASFLTDPSVIRWGNVSAPIYADVSTGHVGGLLKTNLIPYTDLSAKMVAYFYDVKYPNTGYLSEKKAWGRPTFTAELNADVKPIDKLTLSLNYLYAGGRKTYFTYAPADGYSVKMNDINELNFRGEYQIKDWISVNARLNNVLFQEYELEYGYPLQSFNVLGGVSLKF